MTNNHNIRIVFTVIPMANSNRGSILFRFFWSDSQPAKRQDMNEKIDQSNFNRG